MNDIVLNQIINNLILGLTLAIPPGPVTIEMVRRGIKNGFWAAMNIRIGATIGHACILIIAMILLNSLKSHEYIIYIVGILGSLLLIYMGYKNLLSESKLDFSHVNVEHYNIISSLWFGFILAFVNPISVIFWFGIFAANTMNQTTEVPLMINFIILIGVILWGIVLSTSLHFGKIMLNPKVIKALVIIASILMMFFGIKYLLQGIQYFLSQ